MGLCLRNKERGTNMDNFADFDAQFDQTLALVNGNGNGGDRNDPNQFKPSVDEKRPEYLARVRFIPPANGPMFVKKIVHYMKIGNRTVRVICPKTTDGRNQCDICSDNIQSHKSKIPALVNRAKAHGNKTRWVANVLILEDSVRPDNVGRVMWWEFPNQIMEQIEKLKNPPLTSMPSINAFHPTKGADFLLAMKLVGDIPKYDGSMFIVSGGATPISDDVNYINQVRSMCHDIQGQIIIPSPEEIADILSKAGGNELAGVQKTYSNLGFAGTPGPSVGGFAPAQQAVQMDEFDTAFVQAGSATQATPAPQVARPTLAPQAPQTPAPKPVMAVPGRPALQTPESVMPPQAERVTPLPQTPATNQPHAAKPVDDDAWFK